LIGYFPRTRWATCSRPSLLARAEATLGDLDSQFARGEFAGLLTWLRRNVHRHGSRYAASRLIEQATGSPPGTGPLVQSWRKKYGELYGI